MLMSENLFLFLNFGRYSQHVSHVLLRAWVHVSACECVLGVGGHRLGVMLRVCTDWISSVFAKAPT